MGRLVELWEGGGCACMCSASLGRTSILLMGANNRSGEDKISLQETPPSEEREMCGTVCCASVFPGEVACVVLMREGQGLSARVHQVEE